VRVDARWAAGNAADARKYATELVALAPEVILAVGSISVGPLLQATRTVPIISRSSPIRLAPASSRVYRGPVATLPAF